MRGSDLVARLGGDEFSIVQTGNPGAVDTEILCMRIVEAISEPFDIAGSQVRVGVSIGVAIGPDQASEASELYRKTDIALYEAKRQGRGRYLHFAEPIDLTIAASTRSKRACARRSPPMGNWRSITRRSVPHAPAR